MKKSLNKYYYSAKITLEKHLGFERPKNRAWKINQFKHYTTDAPV
jgi:hypothetical protein